ncbi:MAG: CPBP family intramembrane glutamic endopeptidase [Burkholderiales bacterium]
MRRSTDTPPGMFMRIVRFAPVRMGLFYVVLTYLYLSCFFLRATYAQGPLKGLVASFVAGAIMLMVYAFLVQSVEERPVEELAVRPMARELGLGLLLGLGLYTGCVLILTALGNYRIDGQRDGLILLAGMATPLATGVYEELWFRGVVFRLTQEWFGTWVAVAISSLIFGFVHWDAEGATLQGLLSISLWAGPLLCATYVLTGRLWLGIGLHAAWNYTQGSVYSGSVSGNAAPNGFFKSTLQGSDWLTGGSFGMEASVVALAVCATTGVCMLMLAMRRGRIQPSFWKRMAAVRPA